MGKQKNSVIFVVIVLLFISLLPISYSSPVGDTGQPAVKSSLIEWDGADMTMKYDIVNDTINRTIVASCTDRGASWQTGGGVEWNSAVGGMSITKSPVNDTYYISGRDRTNDIDRGYQWVVMKSDRYNLNTWNLLWRQVRSDVINIPAPWGTIDSMEGTCLRYFDNKYFFYFCVQYDIAADEFWSSFYINGSSVESLNATLHDYANWNLIAKENSNKTKDPMVYYNGTKYYLVWSETETLLTDPQELEIYQATNPELVGKVLVYKRAWSNDGEHPGVLLFDNKTSNQFILWTDEVDKAHDRIGWNFYNSTDCENWTFSDTHFKDDDGMTESKNRRYFDYYSEGYDDYVIVMEYEADGNKKTTECCLWDYRPEPPLPPFIEDYEDDTPNSNPTESWYIFSESVGGSFGYVTNENNATWTHTFRVDTTFSGTYEGTYDFTDNVYEEIRYDIYFKEIGSNRKMQMLFENNSVRVGGIKLDDNNKLKIYDSSGWHDTGFTVTSNTWHNIRFRFNYSTYKYRLWYNYQETAWYDYANDNDDIGELILSEPATNMKCDFYIDNLYIGNFTGYHIVSTIEPPTVEETAATLKGYVNYTNNSMQCGFWYDTNSTDTTSSNTTCQGSYDAGDYFTKDVTGLTSGEYYYIRAWGYDTTEQRFVNASNEKYILTKPNPPTNLQMVSSNATNITVSWNNATVGWGTSQKTVIVYDTDNFPSSPNDGTLAYNGTAESYTIESLESGTDYYISVFHYISDSGSPFLWQFSDNYATLKTNTTGGNYTVHIVWECNDTLIDLSRPNQNHTFKIYRADDTVLYTVHPTSATGEFNVTISNMYKVMFSYNNSIKRMVIVDPTDENITIYIPCGELGTDIGDILPVVISFNDFSGYLTPDNNATGYIYRYNGTTIEYIHSDYLQADLSIRAYLTIGQSYHIGVSCDQYRIPDLREITIFESEYTIDVFYIQKTQSIWYSIFTVSSGWTDSTIYVDFLDTSHSGTKGVQNATVYLYYESNNTLIDTEYQVIPWDFNYTYAGLNNSVWYRITIDIYYNKNGEVWNKTIILFFVPTTIFGTGEKGDQLDDFLDGLLGLSPVYVTDGFAETVIGYSSLAAAFIFTLLFFLFSQKFVGIGLISIGSIAALLKIRGIELITDAVLSPQTIAVVIIFGVLVTIIAIKGD